MAIRRPTVRRASIAALAVLWPLQLAALLLDAPAPLIAVQFLVLGVVGALALRAGATRPG